MTDNEIIRALDICGHLESCADCQFGDLEGIDKCMHTLYLNALDQIKRQKAHIETLESNLKFVRGTATRLIDENERLTKAIGNYEACLVSVEKIKANAIKEFAEKLKAEGFAHKNFGNLVQFEDIDALVKETTEETT
mgnify:CR=1 FL=1